MAETYKVDTAELSITSRGVKVELIAPRPERSLGYVTVDWIRAERTRDRGIVITLYRDRDITGLFYVKEIRIVDPEVKRYLTSGPGWLIVKTKGW